MIFQNFGFNRQKVNVAAGAPAPNYVAGAYAIYDFGNTSSYGGTGATVYDVSGNSRNATLIASPTWSSANGGAMEFTNTSSQYMTYTGVIGAASTYMAIVKSKNTPNWNSYSGYPSANFTNGLLSLMLINENVQLPYIYNGASGPTSINSIAFTGLSIGVYNVYTFSVSNTTQKNYLNSTIKTATNTYTRSDSASSTIRVAAGDGSFVNGFLNGYMLGYLHYNFQLTDAEVAQNVAVFSSRY
jgi:hypothetical protein